MSSRDQVAVSLLERARAEPDPLAARLLLSASVQRVARSVGAHAVVSGGTAVDFYAAGAAGTSEAWPAKWAASHDVDVVAMPVRRYESVHERLLHALEDQLGLRPEWHVGTARIVRVPDFPFGLDLVGDELHGDPLGERVFTVMVDDLHPVAFRGPEDVVLAYAESGWDTYHARDWERALAVARAMRDRLDVAWMLDESQRRGKRHLVEAILRGEPLRRRPF